MSNASGIQFLDIPSMACVSVKEVGWKSDQNYKYRKTMEVIITTRETLIRFRINMW
jgi:hypothetical protein